MRCWARALYRWTFYRPGSMSGWQRKRQALLRNRSPHPWGCLRSGSLYFERESQGADQSGAIVADGHAERTLCGRERELHAKRQSILIHLSKLIGGEMRLDGVAVGGDDFAVGRDGRDHEIQTAMMAAIFDCV